MQIAQTNLQLYNQLLRRGDPLEDLVIVHRAYEFLTTLYPGYYQADGKPFVAHGVGVASVLAYLDQPAEMLAFGLLHNIYGNADFGDGQRERVTPVRRALVREAVGARVEELIVRFRDLRVTPRTVEDARRALPDRDETERRVILVDLADMAEKYADLGVLYFGENDWIISAQDRIGGDLIGLARELGQPRLAEMLEQAFAHAGDHAEQVPAELRPSDGRRHLKLVIPRSCRPRVSLTLTIWMRQLRHRLRLRTRLRRVLRTGAHRVRASAGRGAET
jgi:(p)ppGpp synthase/HD superfamily hydrolase